MKFNSIQPHVNYTNASYVLHYIIIIIIIITIIIILQNIKSALKQT